MYLFQSMPRVLAGWLPPSHPRFLNCCSDDQDEEIVVGLFYCSLHMHTWQSGAFQVFPGSKKKKKRLSGFSLGLLWAE